MRARTTLILLLIAVAVGAYVWFVERFEKGTTERERNAHLVLTLDRAQVDRIAIKRANDSVTLVKHADERWHISAPLEDRAEKAAVSSILKLASEFEITRTIPNEELASGEVKVVDLGLDATNGVLVTFFTGENQLASLVVGGAAPWEGTVYCRVLDDPEREDIYVGATGARPILQQPAKAFRDTYLTGHELNTVVGVSIQQGGATEIELERETASPDAAWLLKKPLSTRADSELIDKMLSRFLKARIDSFLPGEGDTTPAPAENAVVVTLRTTDGMTTVTLEPPAEGGSQSAKTRTSDRAGGFLVSDEYRRLFTATDEAKPLWQDLRSRMLGRIDPGQLTTIIVRERGKADIPVWLYGKSWYMTRDSQYAESADKKRLFQLVNGLNQQEILEFSSDTGENLEAYGLANPRFQIDFSGVIHRAKGSPTAAAPENTTTLLIGHGENGRIYSKYSAEPFVYLISPSVLSLLPIDAIKWKNRNLLAFSQSAVQGIIISRPPAPPVEFQYNPGTAEWSATRSDDDVTGMINKQALEKLRQRLAVFYADEWSPTFEPLELLNKWTLEIRLIGKTTDGDETKAVTRVLRFVSTVPDEPDRRTEFYYGQLDSVPEPFLIRKETYEALYDPILVEDANTESDASSE